MNPTEREFASSLSPREPSVILLSHIVQLLGESGAPASPVVVVTVQGQSQVYSKCRGHFNLTQQ